ncbi:MAG TPA: sugar ABC transporter permease [Thermotogota bacterium]|nr:sugar ABC transporter permease [Thermotogota bacterium]HPJ88316.1 sugar ABC transporter permease [Thermotogota bacterium]HPR95336.1 sugar ABC transporter permease [Thermotogota bacterium]
MRLKTKKRLTLFAFLSPWIIIFIVFNAFPIIYSFITSLMDYSGLNPQMNFIGFDNYIKAFQDEIFLKALGNTMIFVIGTVPITTGIALLLALLLNSRNLRSKGIFKAGFFLPSVISMVVISTMWIYLYSSNGLFNTVGSLLGFKMESRSWLASPDTALPSIMIMDIWAAFGYYLILIYAGLQNVPEQLYEAARIDGATPTQIALKITLPYIKPTLFFVISINTIRSFQVFSEIYTMTGGGPRNSTQTIVHYLYQVGFSKFEMGYGTSISYILLVLIMIVTFIQRYLLRSDSV